MVAIWCSGKDFGCNNEVALCWAQSLLSTGMSDHLDM